MNFESRRHHASVIRETTPFLDRISEKLLRWLLLLVGLSLATSILNIGMEWAFYGGKSGAERSQESEQADVATWTFRDCDQCPFMMRLPPGEFSMGSPSHEPSRDANEGPQHQVEIDHAFAIGKYEVTRAQFALFVEGTKHEAKGCRFWNGERWMHSESSDWRNPGFEQTDDDPVVCVSWDDAQRYVRWLSAKTGQNYRLPSEAEWEYAARAGSQTSYFWGDDLGSACDYANGNDERGQKKTGLPFGTFPCEDDYAQTASVGSFEANHFGLHDMSGNVWEWVQDSWHPTYDGAPSDGRPWIGDDQAVRVLRGGSWSYNPENLRSAVRRKGGKGSRNAGDGFRVARDMPSATR